MEKNQESSAMERFSRITEEMNRYIAEREKLDLNAVYERLKHKYSLTLTNTFSLEDGIEEYGEDYMILYGKSSLGEFQLSDCGLYICFDVNRPDGTYTHWHPSNLEDAVNDVDLFMQGFAPKIAEKEIASAADNLTMLQEEGKRLGSRAQDSTSEQFSQDVVSTLLTAREHLLAIAADFTKETEGL